MSKRELGPGFNPLRHERERQILNNAIYIMYCDVLEIKQNTTVTAEGSIWKRDLSKLKIESRGIKGGDQERGWMPTMKCVRQKD